MDSRTGKIYEVDSAEKKEDLEKQLKSKLTMLQDKEHQLLLNTPEENRPCALALYRWIEGRTAQDIPTSLAQKNSFTQGYYAAKKDRP